MTLCRNKYVRFAICFLCILLLVFMQLITPLTMPVKAAISATAAGVIWMILSSAGLNLAVNPDLSGQIMESIIDSFDSDTKGVYNRVFLDTNLAWDGYSGYSKVNIRRNDYTVLSDAVQRWIDIRTLDDGTIKVDLGSGTFVFERTKAYVNTTLYFPKFATEAELRSYFGASLLHFGNGDYTTPTYINTDNELSAYTTVDCSALGGKGGHLQPAHVFPDGSIDKDYGCEQCSVSHFNSLRSTTGYLFVHEMYPRDRGYKVIPFKWYPVGAGSPYYITDGFVSAISVKGNSISVKNLDVELDYPAAGSVSVPLEKDQDYIGGVVAGAWDGLIGKVGTAADSLPFNIPMTEGALGSLNPADVLPKELVQSGSIDVPGEGEISIPSVDNLKLPAAIATCFPFCLPFDLIRLIKVFAHNPIMPSFSIPIKIPDVLDFAISFDFKRFDDVFKVVRLLWNALFIAGLISITKKVVKW